MTEPRYSFEPSPEASKIEKNVKLDNKKSKFAPQIEAKQAATQLHEAAIAAHQKTQTLQQEIFDLGIEFLNIIKNRTVPAQKGVIEQSLERESLQKLIKFAIEMNIDPQEQEGIGSISLLTLVLKVLILLRDKNNVMEHKIYQLEKQLSMITAQKPSSSNT